MRGSNRITTIQTVFRSTVELPIKTLTMANASKMRTRAPTRLIAVGIMKRAQSDRAKLVEGRSAEGPLASTTYQKHLPCHRSECRENTEKCTESCRSARRQLGNGSVLPFGRTKPCAIAPSSLTCYASSQSLAAGIDSPLQEPKTLDFESRVALSAGGREPPVLVRDSFARRCVSAFNSLRRVATPEILRRYATSRRVAVLQHSEPWVETHGYHPMIATRSPSEFRSGRQRSRSRPLVNPVCKQTGPPAIARRCVPEGPDADAYRLMRTRFADISRWA